MVRGPGGPPDRRPAEPRPAPGRARPGAPGAGGGKRGGPRPPGRPSGRELACAGDLLDGAWRNLRRRRRGRRRCLGRPRCAHGGPRRARWHGAQLLDDAAPAAGALSCLGPRGPAPRLARRGGPGGRRRRRARRARRARRSRRSPRPERRCPAADQPLETPSSVLEESSTESRLHQRTTRNPGAYLCGCSYPAAPREETSWVRTRPSSQQVSGSR